MSLEPTDEQAAIIRHDRGPAVVVAVAGSGKTSTMLLRVAALLRRGVQPAEILLSTFSRLGASDFRRRAEQLDVPYVDCRTLHAVARLVLLQSMGFQSEVPARHQLVAVVRQGLQEARGGRRSVLEPVGEDQALAEIQLAKTQLVFPDAWQARDGRRFPSYRDWARQAGRPDHFARAVDACYRTYEGVRVRPDAAGVQGAKSGVRWDDHEDIVAHVSRDVLRGEPWTSSWAGRWPYVVVDEAQDSSLGQWVLAEHLARDRNIMVIGDPEQSVYGFRGARPDMFVDFMKRMGVGLRFYRLTRNYRSGPAILAVANRILGAMRGRLIPDLLVHGRRDGGPGQVQVHVHASQRDEAQWVAERVRAALDQGVPAQQVAVVYRVNSYAAQVESALVQARVRYRVAGRSLFASGLVQAAAAWIRLAVQPDDQEAWKVCWRNPLRWLKREFLTDYPTLADFLRDESRAVARFPKARGIKADVRRVARALEKEGVAKAAWAAYHEVGLLEDAARHGEEGMDEETCRQVAGMVVSAGETFGRDADGFVAHVQAMGREASDKDGARVEAGGVTLTTAHAIKGLQHRVVIVVGLQEGLFPLRGEPEDEEDRLAYVAFTRAMDELHLSWHREGRKDDGRPSRYLSAAWRRKAAST